jgi:hypothetical protein
MDRFPSYVCLLFEPWNVGTERDLWVRPEIRDRRRAQRIAKEGGEE